MSERATARSAIKKSDSKALDGRLRFEETLSEISARFMAVPFDQIDDEIVNALRRMMELFRIDRCALLDVLEQKGICRIRHAVYGEGVEQVSGEVNLAEMYPWCYAKLMRGEMVHIRRLDDYPEDAITDRQFHVATGNKSVIDIPLILGGRISKIIVINSTRRHQAWSKALIGRLQLVSQIFTTALIRKHTEEALRESEARASLATEAVGAGLWIMEIDTGEVWVSPRMRGMFHFGPDEEITYESFVRMIHPDDRDEVDGSVRKALQSGEVLLCEYRIVVPDGIVRWISVRGQSHLRPGQESKRLIGLSFDITDLRQIQVRLHESQTLLDTLINSTSDMIWSVDSEHFGILTFNRGFYEYFLHQRGIQIKGGERPEDLFSEEEFIQQWQMFFRKARDEGSFTTEYEVYEGNRTLLMTLNRLEQNGIVFGISIFGQDITERKGMEEKLREQLDEIKMLKSQAEKENIYLREEIKAEMGFGSIIGESDALRYVLFRAQQVAPTDASVLILGETGTGKGMVAHAIHEMSPRKNKSMITVNCAALPENLIESELFGREKGAFTGAHARQMGRFEVADGGTIFLDEIGEMPLLLQTKLLRVLQDGQFERLGSIQTEKVDVRVIAATSRDLKNDIRSGRFREDLFYRLNVFPVSIPPLRMRLDDVPELVLHFIKKYTRKSGKRIETVPGNVMRMLQTYLWPGNVRELEHIIERAIITSPGPELQLLDRLETETDIEKTESLQNLEALDREHILKVLLKARWKIDGKNGAAGILGLNPSTLRFRIKKLGITRP